ncbi:MAG: type VI secretion system baseplate subunit TssG, partial [Lysobacter sp.]
MIARLLAEPHRFAFFQAVRLLERWFGKADRGGSAAVLSMRLRFRNSLSLAFPASEIAGMRVIEAPPQPVDVELPTVAGALDGMHPPATIEAEATAAARGPSASAIERIELTPAFMGLLGSGGALPIFYTELLAQRETYHRDTAAREFLDVFQHRAVALFYQAWR